MNSWTRNIYYQFILLVTTSSRDVWCVWLWGGGTFGSHRYSNSIQPQQYQQFNLIGNPKYEYEKNAKKITHYIETTDILIYNVFNVLSVSLLLLLLLGWLTSCLFVRCFFFLLLQHKKILCMNCAWLKF